jgi:hypothetical protein
MISSISYQKFKLMKNLTFNIYLAPLNILKNNVISKLSNLGMTQTIELLMLIFNNIINIAKFMLTDRFNPSVPKIKKEPDNRNPDLLKFLGLLPIEKEVKTKNNLDLLHIIKFFKALENFLLKRVLILDLRDLNLGQFQESANLIVDSLTTLLYSVDKLDQDLKDIILNLLFSLICIYRHFKVNVKPDISTITAGYEGEDLEAINNSIFNVEKIME